MYSVILLEYNDQPAATWYNETRLPGTHIEPKYPRRSIFVIGEFLNKLLTVPVNETTEELRSITLLNDEQLRKKPSDVVCNAVKAGNETSFKDQQLPKT